MKEKRITEKIKEIEKYLEELESLFPINIEEYKNNFKTKAICERYFEKIVEAIVDLAFLVIKEKNFKVPEDDKNAFDILADSRTIDKTLAENLKNAKGMRNIIAHEYGKIDDNIVYESITEELSKDAEDFINRINKAFRRPN